VSMTSSVAERSAELLDGPTGRRYAVLIIFLSLTTGISGNGMLCMVGLLTGMMLCNGSRGAGPVVPLAAMTAMLAMIQLIIVLSMFVSILSTTPQGFCRRSGTLVEYITGVPPTQSAINQRAPTASGDSFAATQDGEDSLQARMLTTTSPPPPLGYPWNMTSGAAGYASSPSAQRLLVFVNKVHEIACGPNSSLFILSMSLLLLAYSAMILMPLVIIAVRAGRLARGAGGCADVAVARPLYAVVVQGNPATANSDAAVGVPVRVANGTIPTANVRPGHVQPGGPNVAQARPVVGAPVTGSSMH